MDGVKLLALLALPMLALAQDEGAVSPYRPSVSSPAQLPLAGQLEFEIGGLHARGNGVRRDSLPYTFKLAWSEEWGALVGGDGYVSARDDAGLRLRGVGDTTLVLKRAFPLDDATAFGLEAGVKLPTARDGIGSGRRDYELNGILSKDLASVHLDANLNLTRLGAWEAGTGRIQTGLSASCSVPLAAQWTATAELSGNGRRAAASNAQLLLATTYSPNKRLAIDIGVARGLDRASAGWSFFSGVVLPLARLW